MLQCLSVTIVLQCLSEPPIESISLLKLLTIIIILVYSFIQNRTYCIKPRKGKLKIGRENSLTHHSNLWSMFPLHQDEHLLQYLFLVGTHERVCPQAHQRDSCHDDLWGTKRSKDKSPLLFRLPYQRRESRDKEPKGIVHLWGVPSLAHKISTLR